MAGEALPPLPLLTARHWFGRYTGQGRHEGGNGGTILWTPSHYGGAKSLRRHRKVPTMSQVLS